MTTTRDDPHDLEAWYRSIPAGASAVYAKACAETRCAAGFYNRNVHVTYRGMPVNVRIPVPEADQMDHRQWPEPSILTTIAAHVPQAPRLYFESTDPVYQIQEYIDGTALHILAPRGQPVPDQVPGDVARLFAQLRRIPPADLPDTAEGLDDDPQRFARRLWNTTRHAYTTRRDQYARLFRRLGVPHDPFEPLDRAWTLLNARPFRLLHCDLHRRNMIIRPSGDTVFLDWELALYGDPLADVAIHLHKMTYTHTERQHFLRQWTAAEPQAATPDWEHDLQIYLTHETLKGAVLDAVRYAKVFAEHSRTPADEHTLVESLTRKLAAAAPFWNIEPPQHTQVEAALRDRPCLPQ
ncbi:phosphotransferase family protein [Nocardia carnea]|uniref:phosphotransferase family protein n=1 Tax=Nocardia carnea TaxID=37328 RepID=UPI002457FEAA|nr:phosphotransferase [Nocardia carnea]